LLAPPNVMDPLTLRVAALHYRRVVLAAFISEKWFRTMKTELRDILKKPLKDNPEYWGYVFRDQVEGFFDRFQREFEEQVVQPKARDSIKGRVEMAKNYLKAVVEKIEKATAFGKHPDFKDPESYLTWYAVSEIHEKMSTQAKTFGDLYKWSWTVDEEFIKRLVKRTLKAANAEELVSLTDGDNYRVKYQFLDRVGFKAAALRALKREKLEWDPSKWVDRIYEMLQANYSEQAIQESENFDQFNLNGVKVIVNDKTVDGGDIKKYVAYLKEAHEALKSKGFGAAWYGNVYIECKECGGVNQNTGGGVGGWFEIQPDTVTVFVRPSPFVVELMVHELGHRYWFKQMSGSQRAKFTDLVKVHTVRRPEKPVEVKMFKDRDLKFFKNRVESCEKNANHNLDRARKLDLERAVPKAKDLVEKAFWDIGVELNDVASELDVDKAVAADPEVSRLRDDAFKAKQELVSRAEDLSLQRPDTFNEWSSDMDQLIAGAIANTLIYLDFASQKQNEFAQAKLDADPKTKEWLDSYEKNPAPVLPVSNYGKSNIDEAFAEVFAHYVLGFPPLSRDQLESFRSVLSYEETVEERVLRRFLMSLPQG